MAENDDPFHSAEWQELHRQYLNALASFYPVQPPDDMAYTDSRPWNDALELWWKSVQGELDNKNKPVFDAILNQSRIFYSITDQFANMIKEIAASGSRGDDWREILDRHIERMKSMFDQYGREKSGSPSAPTFMWAQPLESWKKAMSGMSVFSEEAFEKMMQQGVEAYTEKLSSIPGIGMTGEYQEKLQKTLRLWNRYQAASIKYHRTFSDLGKLAVDRLQENILAKAEKNEKITSLREIYNMWIDANEEVFASHVKQEEYSELYGDLVNALVDLRKHSNELSDEMFRVLNIPTSAGVNTVTRRQHQLKNELRATMEVQMKAMETLEQIQADLKKIQDSLTGQGRTRAAKKTGGRKKKTSKSKTRHSK